MKFEDLQKQVLEWGDEKGITHSENIDKQLKREDRRFRLGGRK